MSAKSPPGIGFLPSSAVREALIAGLATADRVVLARSWPETWIAALRAEAEQIGSDRMLGAALIGRGTGAQVQDAVRGDQKVWLDALDRGRFPALTALRAEFEVMRAALNRGLLLGVDEVEAQLACYPVGHGYARHLDRFADHDARVLSLVLYLNEGWRAADGGALRLHAADGAWQDVAPAGGTLVAFLSDRVEHEVLPTARIRWSVTAWFRNRPH